MSAPIDSERPGQKRNRRWIVPDTMVKTNVIENAAGLACPRSGVGGGGQIAEIAAKGPLQ